MNIKKFLKIVEKNWLAICSMTLILCIFILGREFYLPLNPGPAKTVVFVVQKGDGAKEISIELKKEGLIEHSSMFRIYSLLLGVSKKLQSGRYELSSDMSVSTIVDMFASGDIIKEKLTIIEGWDLKDIAQYFEDKGVSSKSEFLNLAKKDFSKEFNFLNDKPKDLDLEGYIFPDTYEIIPPADAEDILRSVLTNFGNKLTPDLRQEIDRQKKSIFEIITMASLIEKEVITLDDKKIVSGILWKRLDIGMPLQIDATITYITGKNNTAVSMEDIQIDSPYNTYKYYGLPLGPISNPGSDSIVAAIYPVESDYFFYLSTPEGETIFSKTLKEHNQARTKYLR
jgi:UPF0755 protein